MRRLVAGAHRWAGLMVGLYLSLVGITGAGLVAAPLLFAWEHDLPELPAERARDQPVSLDIWVAKATARYGNLPTIESFNAPLATPLRIAAPTMMYSTMRDGEYVSGVIAVDPYSGEPLAHFIAHDSLSFWPLRLHMAMFLPYTVMWTFLAGSAWLLVALVLLGVWSLPRRPLRDNLRPEGLATASAMRQTHLALGLIASPLLLLAGLTGLLMTDKSLSNTASTWLGATELHHLAMPCDATLAITPGAALSAALLRYPESELGSLEKIDTGGFSVTLRRSAQSWPSRGDIGVTLDACGAVRTEARPGSMGNALSQRIVDLHNGRVAGSLGEWLVAAAGLALFALPSIAIAAWIRRRWASPRATKQRCPE